MWQVAFSSKSVFWNTSPVFFTAEVPSTSATSPRYGACASASSWPRMTSAPCEARDVDDPAALEAQLEIANGRAQPTAAAYVERTVPSVRRRSGEVNTSSVGRFGMCSIPSAVVNAAAHPAGDRHQPDERSVPGPRNRIASNACAFSCAARALRRASCSRQAATGSAASSRVAVRDRFPQPLEIGLAEHASSPSPRSARRRSPS